MDENCKIRTFHTACLMVILMIISEQVCQFQEMGILLLWVLRKMMIMELIPALYMYTDNTPSVPFPASGKYHPHHSQTQPHNSP